MNLMELLQETFEPGQPQPIPPAVLERYGELIKRSHAALRYQALAAAHTAYVRAYGQTVVESIKQATGLPDEASVVFDLLSEQYYVMKRKTDPAEVETRSLM